MKLPDYQAAEHYARTRLEHELPAFLSYHSLGHTCEEVLPAAEFVAVREGFNGHALLLLRTAAWYHDIGFVAQIVDHEAIGVRIAGTVLPRFGYTLKQVAMIGGMIMATRLPQVPQTKLEQILADADLDVLGRSNFKERNADLRNELAVYGTTLSDHEWYSGQLAFLQSHHYWTETAQTLRTMQKQRNMNVLIELLETAKDPTG